ncbi:MAG: 5'/3'-nucleotidase SurE [Dehalococcoidia bacterium]|nr:5'/3'-nucleotidase SurE [Dehalococcoidia bacterium]
MKILITNDDGIYAPGLWILAKELSKVAEVIVVAPDREQSAVGTAVSLRKPLIVQKITPLAPGTQAYSVEGTPADSVILALGKIVDKVDLVVSGINRGANLGEDVLISGTVGAALVGYLRGFPAIAVSTAEWDDVCLTNTGRFIAMLASKIHRSELGNNVFLNVNMPMLPVTEVKGVQITRLASKSHINTVEEGHDGKRTYYVLVRQAIEKEPEEKTDIWAINHGNISITPLNIFFGNRFSPAVLEGLCSGLLDELK